MVYRPRTISYSFEDSEKANAAYEDIQASDNDSVYSLPHPPEIRTLHEELRGSSLQSVSITSNPSSPPGSPSTQRVTSGISQVELVSEDRRAFIFTSPRLYLPPPFSAVPRSTSLNVTPSIVNSAHAHLQARSASSPIIVDSPESSLESGATIPVTRGYVRQSPPANVQTRYSFCYKLTMYSQAVLFFTGPHYPFDIQVDRGVGRRAFCSIKDHILGHQRLRGDLDLVGSRHRYRTRYVQQR